MQSAQDQHWRQVPKVNVLGELRRISPKDLGLKVLLVAIVLVGAVVIWQERGATQDTNQRVVVMTRQLLQLEQDLAAKKQEKEALEVGINDLKKEREANEQAYAVITGGGTNWYSAFADLFTSVPQGIEFGSAIAEPGGRIILGGAATEPESILSLPLHMISISDTLDFQGIAWVPDTDPPVFSATFQVRR